MLSGISNLYIIVDTWLLNFSLTYYSCISIFCSCLNNRTISCLATVSALGMSSSKDEAVKLQKHLSLLRQEYSKLQQKYVELEHSYGLLSGQTGAGAKDSYASRLVRSAAELFDNNMFSDMTVSEQIY